MTNDLNNEAPNVVTETLFRALIRQGYHAEVVCREEAYKTAAVWYGVWIIRLVNPERTYEKLLVPARQRANRSDEISARIFKTANGLISFMRDVGFKHVDVPLEEGMRSIHVFEEEGPITE